METIGAILAEVCLFLDAKSVFTILSRVSKDWGFTLNSNNYKIYWIKQRFGVNLDISLELAITLYKNTITNWILDFKPWKTDAGVSRVELDNSYDNMFRYNGTSFSTFYSTTSVEPLRKNLNCLALFSGGYQPTETFFHSFHNDMYQLLLMPHNIPNAYQINNFDQSRCLILDPLSNKKYDTYLNLSNENITRPSIPNTFVGKKELFLSPKTTNYIPLVTKIAIARPFFYTGAVKSMMIIANQEYDDASFEQFKVFNDIETLETALSIASVARLTKNEDFISIEYQQGIGFYPLLWVKFLKIDVNHLEIELSKAQIIRCLNVKLYDIDDRREEYDLINFQPNFDITYTLMIGLSIEN